MGRNGKRAISVISLFFWFALAATAQESEPVLSIVAAGKTTTISARDWAAMPKTKVTASNAHDKSSSVYSGVLLRELLRKAGVLSDQELRGRELAACVKLTAKDGYVAVFALAEIDPSLRDEDVLVADIRDGKPLAPDHGPLQVIVPGDKRPARWIRMLTRIEVISMRP